MAGSGRSTSPRPRNAVTNEPRAGSASNTSSVPVGVPWQNFYASGSNSNGSAAGQSDPGNMARAGPSSLEHHEPAHDRGFARSFTVGDAGNEAEAYMNAHADGTRRRVQRPPARSGQPRAISFHPGASGAPDQRQDLQGLAYETERRGSNIGDLEGRRVSMSGTNSSDIVLHGRSYRFQQHPDHYAMASPYTATSSSIRDKTALLAGMLLRNEEDADRSVVNADTIDERPEDEDASGNSPERAAVHITGFKQSRAQDGSSPRPPTLSSEVDNAHAPSNLSKAMLRTASNSPTDTIKETDGAKDAASAQELHDTQVDERTPLLARGGKEQAVKSDPPSSGRSSRTRSASRSKSPLPEHSGFSNVSGVDSAGHFAVATDSHGHSSAYGYGAMAQASQARSEQHVTFAQQGDDDDDDNDDDNEPTTLSPAWKLMPRFLRPGRGEIPVGETNMGRHASHFAARARKLTFADAVEGAKEPIRVLPAVFLGVLLNVLDGVSYGLIIFPTSYSIFSDFGGDGVSMFFVTCIISQLVYSLGGSIFKGGNGSMMIEVVPFYHILVTNIIAHLGEDQPEAIIATTMVAIAMSSIFAGIVFLALGKFRLGVLIGFFPRHILVGCIGGVGVFLIETGLEVSAQLKSEAGFQWDKVTFDFFTDSWLKVAHWLPPLVLAILLRVITARFHHPLIFPGYFLVIPAVFYTITAGLGVPLAELQRYDWVFDVGSAAEAPFWRFYTYFNFSNTSWAALWSTMPTQLALTFFSILHVPLNIPALSVSLNEDNLDLDRELFAHGISNITAGLAGSVPNYLCYVNSVLFYRVGGGSRLSGLMLAAGTTMIFLAGPGAIGYLPIMVVGALIFVLGIDLFKEAVWDTIGRVNAWEYSTIWLIIGVMTYYDFVVGILAGILVACLFFVIQTSRRRTVRAVLDGSIARSTVRRHTTQRNFLSRIGQQTQIVKLQGFLYFATISSVEELIRRGLDIAQWQHHPIRFLIVDFSLVSGVDFSAAEAFVRVERVLKAKSVLLIFCGVTPDSDVGIALRSVDLWTTNADMQLEVFQNLNEALEWTENSYLLSMYASGQASAKSLRRGHRGALDMPKNKRAPAFHLADSAMDNSPRKKHLYEAAQEASKASNNLMVLASHSEGDSSLGSSYARAPKNESAAEGQRRVSTSSVAAPHVSDRPHPFSLLVLTFQAWLTEQHDEQFFATLAPYFQKVQLLSGETLWQRGDDSNGIYVIESGILKARYDFPQEDYEINESMLAGTIAGELTFLSRAERNTTAFADLDCTLWKIDRASMTALRKADSEVHERFTQLLISAGTEEQEGLMSYLVSRLS